MEKKAFEINFSEIEITASLDIFAAFYFLVSGLHFVI